MMLGVRAEVEFYKQLFDNFEVKPDMLKVGKYKSRRRALQPQLEMSDGVPRGTERRSSATSTSNIL